mgnify:CR=1 FL=1
MTVIQEQLPLFEKEQTHKTRILNTLYETCLTKTVGREGNTGNGNTKTFFLISGKTISL